MLGNKMIQDYRIRLPFLMEFLALSLIPFEEIFVFSGGGFLRIINFVTIFLSIVYICVEKHKIYINIKNPVVYLIYLLGLALLSRIWCYNPTYYVDTISTFGFYTLFIVVLLSLEPNPKEFNLMIKGLYFGGLIASILVVFSNGIVDIGSRETLFILGRVVDPNILSCSVVCSSLINLYSLFNGGKGIKRYILISMQIILVYAVILLGSRGGFISLIFAILYMLLKMFLSKEHRTRNIIIILLTVLAICFFYYGFLIKTPIGVRFTYDNLIGKGEFGSANRFTIWESSIKAFISKPILGYGCGSSPYAIAEFYRFYGTHNLYLRLLVEYGIVGGILQVFWLANINKSLKDESMLLIKVLFCAFLIINVFIDGFTSKFFWGIMIVFCSGGYLVVYEKDLLDNHKFGVL